jgi:hypothetical protein
MNERKRDTQGQTLPQQGETQERRPRTPNEHDESADSQSSEQPGAQRIGELAHEDLRQGRKDTDKGPVLDATYEKVKKSS